MFGFGALNECSFNDICDMLKFPVCFIAGEVFVPSMTVGEVHEC